jgi:talin
MQDLVEYKKKHRPLRVILMDESQRTVLIDDSHTVGQIIKVICARINLSNPDEFSLTGMKGHDKDAYRGSVRVCHFASSPAVDELDRSEQSAGGIYEESKKEKEKKAKDEKKMQKLQEKLHTDDERMYAPAGTTGRVCH